MTTATRDLFTVTQAADRLGVSRQRLFRLIRRGKLQIERCGWVYLLSEEQIEQAREKLRIEPPEE